MPDRHFRLGMRRTLELPSPIREQSPAPTPDRNIASDRGGMRLASVRPATAHDSGRHPQSAPDGPRRPVPPDILRRGRVPPVRAAAGSGDTDTGTSQIETFTIPTCPPMPSQPTDSNARTRRLRGTARRHRPPSPDRRHALGPRMRTPNIRRTTI